MSILIQLYSSKSIYMHIKCVYLLHLNKINLGKSRSIIYTCDLYRAKSIPCPCPSISICIYLYSYLALSAHVHLYCVHLQLSIYILIHLHQLSISTTHLYTSISIWLYISMHYTSIHIMWWILFICIYLLHEHNYVTSYIYFVSVYTIASARLKTLRDFKNGRMQLWSRIDRKNKNHWVRKTFAAFLTVESCIRINNWRWWR